MNWNKDDSRSGKRGYHHGNLREALITAALDLISEKGPAGFTFAEAARAAGVSGAAPYRHFRDRDALLASVALQGYEAFFETLNAAKTKAHSSPRDAVVKVGAAYLEFARSEPAYFSAMFESGLCLADYPEVRVQADKAFDVLRGACEMVLIPIPEKSRPPVLMVALHLWSLAHGTAALFARGDKARRPIPMSAAELLEAAAIVYLEGLGVPADQGSPRAKP
jgi:AcrR family transcriptional regulator